MLHRLRSHLTYANVAATLALFLALSGGVAFAVTQLDRNSVRSKHILNGQVKAVDLADTGFHSAGLAANSTGVCTDTPNQWASYKPNTYGPVGYYRDLEGRVHLSGQPLHCNPSTTAIFTLPRGYRPAHEVENQPALRGANEVAQVTLFDTGGVVPITLSDGETISLAGISFRCGPSGQNGCP